MDALLDKAARHVVRTFCDKEGVDLSLDPQAYRLIMLACEDVLSDLRNNGHANVVLPCIAKRGKRQLHLDVTIFLDEIERPGGDTAGQR